MTRIRPRGEEIRRFIVEHVDARPSGISKFAAHRFGVTRQAINRHLMRLVREGSLRESGQTRGRTYTLAPLVEWTHSYEINQRTEEDVVWRTDIEPVLGQLSDNAKTLWFFGFSEMFNNARDHSSGTSITVKIEKTAVATEMLIYDDGVGIFKKIQKEKNLLDERHAIFELSKGKLTTDPSKHTGEGIFFTSRAFDHFVIMSGGVYFSHEIQDREDWLLDGGNIKGTSVMMKLNNHTSRTLKKVFDEFTSGGENLGFTKTIVPVSLAQYGNEMLLSRSQAKRVMARVNVFETVILDFKGVSAIGQAFADEIFRVFAREHPRVKLSVVNADEDVSRMIERATSNVVPLDEPSGGHS